MLRTFEEMSNDESICNYCSRTDYGEHKSGVNPNGYWSCEGSFCKESYESYLDNENTNENIVKYASKVKLINKGDYE